MALTSTETLETPRPSAEVQRHLHLFIKGETIPEREAGIWQICQGLLSPKMLLLALLIYAGMCDNRKSVNPGDSIDGKFFSPSRVEHQ